MAARVAVLLLLGLLSVTRAIPHSRKLLSPPLAPGTAVTEAMWFKNQKLDHFSDRDTRTWSQRYFVNDSLWERESGPVFLMLGGEGPADPAWLATNTDIMRNAAKFKAIVIFLEHRFYGESHPTPDASLDSLVYLSSRQALSDAAAFKTYIVDQYNMSDQNRWISFGGSYSGALSGWLRMYYPDTVDGAVATSGPVQAELNFYQYLEVVAKSLATTKNGDLCVEAIRNATFILDVMLSDSSQWPAVEKMFHVSSPLKNQDDVALLASSLAGNFMGVVQYNRDNTAFEGRPNNITMDDLCDIMANTSRGSPLERYAAVNDLLLKAQGEETVDADFAAEVKAMKESGWSSGTVKGGARQWVYQTCTEFGYYQTTDSAQQPFGDLVTLSSQLKICSEVFGLSPSQVEAAVAHTNSQYGGRDNIPSSASNIVFPNGSIDPWHALGFLESPQPSLVTIFIIGTAHCANMYPPSPHDPLGLVLAREAITTNIQVWLSGISTSGRVTP